MGLRGRLYTLLRKQETGPLHRCCDKQLKRKDRRDERGLFGKYGCCVPEYQTRLLVAVGRTLHARLTLIQEIC